ncbi:hypothetical protein H0H92_015909, partial [Tricholoma furcatifolium]
RASADPTKNSVSNPGHRTHFRDPFWRHLENSNPSSMDFNGRRAVWLDGEVFGERVLDARPDGHLSVAAVVPRGEEMPDVEVGGINAGGVPLDVDGVEPVYRSPRGRVKEDSQLNAATPSSNLKA